MELHADVNDWRLYRVRSFSLGVRATTWTFAAVLVLLHILDVGSAGLEGPSGYRLTLVGGFQVQTQGELGWQDLAFFAFWVPVLGVGLALLHQVDRLLASFQGRVIVDAGNARRLSRIGIFILALCALLLVGHLLEFALSASLGLPSNKVIFSWCGAGLVFRAIGYAMAVACEIAEEAGLTARMEQLAPP